nr:immunoglobulin heavy chain junction region [Macaca mulatta]MOW98301.1 immunoglobulin heavy chain junction region [Macaca mulatta]MOW98549.1 immunoglobulin heavy chain junction region [Macaca mulatta]MOW98589.1 immunoglobulin heavy chain junction region [Macaca mulatta]MOW99551.1 immunoglobulin heavy chain junction region [Macaca mulatta]
CVKDYYGSGLDAW